LIINEIHITVDIGLGLWSGTCHVQPPLSPKEYMETLDYAGGVVRDLCNRQRLILSQIQETQITILRVETVEAADLPSTLDKMPVVLPGHRKATKVFWTWVPRDTEGSSNGN